jgi:adenylate cyclase
MAYRRIALPANGQWDSIALSRASILRRAIGAGWDLDPEMRVGRVHAASTALISGRADLLARIESPDLGMCISGRTRVHRTDVIQLLSPTTGSMTRRLRAVLFVDVVDSVRLIQQDQEGTIARWRAFLAAVIGNEVVRHNGRMVKSQGDGMLLEFATAVDAVECALAMQSRIQQSDADLLPDQRIRLRMGINLADVLADDIDLYGDGVNLAARLRDLGGPEEIVISAAVRDQLANGLGVSIEDLGERRLKGIERPVRAFRAWPPGPLPSRSPDRVRHAGDRPSIAVLPFRNLSGDPAHDFLGELVAEDLIGILSRQTDLFVISRLSTTPFRDRLFEPRSVAEILGVRYVLSGSMHTSGTRLRLSAELTEAEAGRVIWAERFEGSLADIFELQDQLSSDIARCVVPYVRRLELRRARSKPPENLTAYERVLRAVDHLHRSSHEDIEQARLMLEAAIESDSAYATPYAWLARLYVLRVGQGWSPDAKRDAINADHYAEAALERDETDPWAISVHGLVAAYLHKDLETAIARYDRALTINPSTPAAWAWSTAAHAWLGRGEEAVMRAPKAIQLSPLDPHRHLFTAVAGTAYAVAGDYATAIDCLQRSLRENRMYTAPQKVLAISFALSGQIDRARQVVADLLELEPSLTVSEFRGRYPGSASAHVERFCAALAEAGVPP